MDSVTLIRVVAGLLFIVIIPVMLIPYWMIFKKAGFSPALSLLMVFPLVNLIVLYVVAFSTWKVAPIYQIAAQPTYPPRA